MRTSTPNKIFCQKIKHVLHGLKNQTLSFTQLLQVCARNNIKFSSRQQIELLKQHFNKNNLQIEAASIFSNFQLIKIQAIQSKKYFVIKLKWITQFDQNPDFTPIHHKFQKCIYSFFESMKKCYGSQTNWFKSLGGLTIAISMQRQPLMRGIQKAMKGTSHSHCYHLIFQQFIRQDSSKCIHWLTFMNTIIKLRLIQADCRQNNKSHTLNRVINIQQNRRKSLHSSNSSNFECRSLSLQFKKCKLYTKQDFFDGLSFVKLRKTESLFRSLSKSSKVRAKTSLRQQIKFSDNSFYKSNVKCKTKKSIIMSKSNVHQKLSQNSASFFATETQNIKQPEL